MKHAARVLSLSTAFVLLSVFPVGAALAPAPVRFDNPTTTVFINEIHYDNTGTDAGEAIEIAGPAGTDLTGWSLVLYNGSGGAVYDTDPLSGVIADQADGYGTLQLREVSTGVATRQMTGRCRSRMAFSPDGAFLAGSDGGRLRVWNVATGGEQLPMPGEVGWVDRLTFSRDGSLLFAGGPEGSAGRLWSVRDARQLLALPARAHSVAMSTETQILVTAEWQTLRFWDLSTGTERGAADIWSAGYVRALAVLDGGKTVASGSEWDGLIRLWDITSRRLMAEFPGSSARHVEDTLRVGVLCRWQRVDEPSRRRSAPGGECPAGAPVTLTGWRVAGTSSALRSPATDGEWRRRRGRQSPLSTHPRRRVGRLTPRRTHGVRCRTTAP
jgi:hypothetical protein